MAKKKSTAGGPWASMKFRPPVEVSRSTAKGAKPLAEAMSVVQVLVMMLVQLCRKLMYGVEMSHRVGIYMIGTFLLGVAGDLLAGSSGTGARSYWANKDNVLNVYFVKFCWGWTLLTLGAFSGMAHFTSCCGNSGVLKQHLARLGVATFVWYTFTSLFNLIEDSSGMCNVTKFNDPSQCVSNGFKWKGFDISGHTFLLMLCNLIILEEGKAYLGWERIKDMLRNEEHKRLSLETTPSESTSLSSHTPLSKLSLDQFLHLRTYYHLLTPWLRGLFCIMCCLVLMCDWMLICTILYFHIMAEKVVASALAIMIWFLLYRVLYLCPWFPIGAPGCRGPFNYVTYKEKSCSGQRQEGQGADVSGCHHSRIRDPKKSANAYPDGVPKFMGMPLYALANSEPAPESVSQSPSASVPQAVQAPLRSNRSRSRSASTTQLSQKSSSRSTLNLKYL